MNNLKIGNWVYTGVDHPAGTGWHCSIWVKSMNDSEQLSKWLNDNLVEPPFVGEIAWSVRGEGFYGICMNNEQDAMLFKLTWSD